jgi:hypothetical protein
MTEPIDIRALRVVRRGSTIFIPLPTALWRPIDPPGCSCVFCVEHPLHRPSCLDTLALSADDPATSHTWMVHKPELQWWSADEVDRVFKNIDVLKAFFEGQ